MHGRQQRSDLDRLLDQSPYGYCIANHLANFNGGHHGVGWVRSTESGKVTSSLTGNRAPEYCVTTQGDYAPVSN